MNPKQNPEAGSIGAGDLGITGVVLLSLPILPQNSIRRQVPLTTSREDLKEFCIKITHEIWATLYPEMSGDDDPPSKHERRDTAYRLLRDLDLWKARIAADSWYAPIMAEKRAMLEGFLGGVQ